MPADETPFEQRAAKRRRLVTMLAAIEELPPACPESAKMLAACHQTKVARSVRPGAEVALSRAHLRCRCKMQGAQMFSVSGNPRILVVEDSFLLAAARSERQTNRPYLLTGVKRPAVPAEFHDVPIVAKPFEWPLLESAIKECLTAVSATKLPAPYGPKV